jgi:hypothetical protein
MAAAESLRQNISALQTIATLFGTKFTSTTKGLVNSEIGDINMAVRALTEEWADMRYYNAQEGKERDLSPNSTEIR